MSQQQLGKSDTGCNRRAQVPEPMPERLDIILTDAAEVSAVVSVLQRLNLDLDASHAFLVEFDEQQMLPIRFSVGKCYETEMHLSGTVLPDAVALCLQKKFCHQLSWAVDIQGNEPDEFYRWSKEYYGARSVISCPVVSKNGVKGILILYAMMPRQWQQEELDQVQESVIRLQPLLTPDDGDKVSACQANYVEESLWNFFANGSVGFQWIAPDGRILRMNKAGLDLLGYGNDEYVGQLFSWFCAERFEGEDILSRFRSGEILRCYPIRLKCRDGSVKTVQISTGTCRREDVVQYTRCLMQDMTAKQAQIEEILHQSQERYWSLYEWERKTREVLQVIRQSLAMDQVFLWRLRKWRKLYRPTGRLLLSLMRITLFARFVTSIEATPR